jgi:hypothetical protein
MCNCYGHKCEECGDTIPMHIGDFKFPPEAFKCWCHRHVKSAPVGAIVFRLSRRDMGEDLPKGWKCAILGPEVGPYGDNSPNVGVPCSWEEIKAKRDRGLLG